jgi:hypothetical protein
MQRREDEVDCMMRLSMNYCPFDRILKIYSRDCSSIVLFDECVHYSSDERGQILLWVRTGMDGRRKSLG